MRKTKIEFCFILITKYKKYYSFWKTDLQLWLQILTQILWVAENLEEETKNIQKC